MTIPFCKFHGFGNDYIVIERNNLDDGAILSELGAAICDRHTGAGADGIAVLHRLDDAEADYFCEIINPDGSTAGFSGNGTRCAVAYLHHKGIWPDPRLRLDTRSGVKNYELIDRRGDDEFWFEAEIGRPKFASAEVPFKCPQPLDAVVNAPIMVDGREFWISAVNIGNPVACIFVEDLNFDWRTPGRSMETHEKFPDRANIVFVKIIDRENIDIRIWERGAGETAASGTCSSGAAVLSAFLLKTGRKVRVHSEGGITDVLWRNDDEIVLTGRADFVYCGEWP
ncbi:diaminopimelate epimerase [soil metagenome]